ncbi:surface lipoprotein assembly modifier [Alysiella crassa]|uniref:TPR repeat-containing protein NMB0313 n=1 Tax=Alysiella crassa TaxID=153491 RepID=A0A376BMW7_9NEIS|nr:surface lipoprotein assembly modifier [Alysiella crassa]UOP06875.1 surface lipoprotein assembly modifier [Alysiella crassa]SSY70998.1 TPR repeat-containing protein NMB0313 precursor [Alysiella crassa]
MKTLKSLLCSAVMFAMAGAAFANDAINSQSNTLERERDQLQQKQETQPSQDDLLRTQQIGHVEKPEWGLSDAELLRQPEKLEKLLAVYLAQGQRKQVAHLVDLYKQQRIYRDDSLIEWAIAMSHAQTNLRRAIYEYRILTGKFPDNQFIRYQLATLLFANQEYDAAEGQFQKLRASSSLTQQDVQVIDDYLNAIARKNKWNFSLGATFLHDKNLTDQAKVGTTFHIPNTTAVLRQDNPPEQGTGFNFNVNASKQWSLPKGQYISLDGSADMKYYWDNKGFNELSTYGGVSYGYADAKVNVRVSPYIVKRFKAGGKDASSKLSAYTNTFGTSVAADVWVSPKWKQSASYTFSRDNYVDDAIDKRHGGKSHSSGFGATYYRSPKQYFGAAMNVSRFDAGAKTESYKRYGGRVYWGQEWAKGFVTRSSVGLNERKYEAPFFNVRRKDKEWNTNVSLWHKAVHYKGITPRLSWNYYKRKSNIDIFSYDKHMTFIELDKSF